MAETLALDREQLLALLAREFPQSRHLQLAIEALQPGRIRVRSGLGEDSLRPGGTVSGPTMMWLADVATYLLILAMRGPVTLAVTTSLSINFLRKPALGDLVAEATLLKLGKRLAVAEVHIGGAGEASLAPVAHATVTYSIPPDPERR